MKLSVIIVNYNVEYFLEQCLLSVRKAMKEISGEIFVVDNNSVDHSVAMVKEKFPEVILIANQENTGFSRANNQAMKIARGEYFLLLNPDTVVEEDTFQKIIDFMDSHPDAGGLGVKMVDGKGQFLPESKRGLPTPAVAFYKIFGLAGLFPRSKTFGQYHLSYLDNDKIHQVDILAGAFMLMRKSALDKIGLLDETFFMYGEDIDLSWRIILGGYKNYYFPETRIIHYKGESTRKSSVNYVLIFYNAMLIFARKHFSRQKAGVLTLLIKLAIYFRAGLSIARRFASRAFLPTLDGLLIFLGSLVFIRWWEPVILEEGYHYPTTFLFGILPVYTATWLFSSYLSGAYDRPARLIKVVQGLFAGTITILVFYSLLNEEYRFSRAVILFGAIWGMLAMSGLRLILHYLGFKQYQLSGSENQRYAIIGAPEECNRVAALLRQTHPNAGLIALIDSTKGTRATGFVGQLHQLADIITIYKIDELVFCSRDLSAGHIIDLMSQPYSRQLDYKIAPQNSGSIIGSNSISTLGDPFIIDIDSIAKPRNKRNKRLTDLLISFAIIPALPLLIVVVNKPIKLLTNVLSVVFGLKTWVSYAPTQFGKQKLPGLKSGPLSPADAFPERDLDDDTLMNLNLLYAKHYRVTNDLNIVVTGIKKLGN
ncbi:MAG: glycosyltransferase [Bacteroidales bacterium]|nr:glycosyltransferase [Bacteroidales bacterium]